MATMAMRFTSGASDAVQADRAIAEATAPAAEALGAKRCHLACVFASPAYRARWDDLLAQVHDRLHPAVLIGCSASGVIGADREFEGVPALSVVAAHLPDVRLHPFAISPQELERSSPGGFWVDKVGALPGDAPVLVLLADPFTCDAPRLLAELNATYPTRPMIGGLASGGTQAGEHGVFFDTQVLQDGAVGLAMTGNIALEAIVSQGCRPIGRSYVVTKAEGQVIWELGGRPALEVLREALMGLSPSDQELAQQAIFVGLVIDEMRTNFGSGDFLIRHLVGVDPPSGAIAVAEDAQPGQSLQFHVRDPQSSHQELVRLLSRHRSSFESRPPAGALFFNCSGRGKAFYGVPHRDTRTIRGTVAQLSFGGFFCNGEIGPVGGRNFLHGYTASLGLFRPLDHAGDAR